jgi:hypothetical protein
MLGYGYGTAGSWRVMRELSVNGKADTSQIEIIAHIWQRRIIEFHAIMSHIDATRVSQCTLRWNSTIPDDRRYAHPFAIKLAIASGRQGLKELCIDG